MWLGMLKHCMPTNHRYGCTAAVRGNAMARPVSRGYTRLYQEHVTQAHEGCDFDFLQGDAPSPEPSIY